MEEQSVNVQIGGRGVLGRFHLNILVVLLDRLVDVLMTVPLPFKALKTHQGGHVSPPAGFDKTVPL